MAEVINLRHARKRAQRRQDEALAQANRLAHGLSKHRRELAATQREKEGRDLEAHRIEKGDD